jgi:hypothetical protein
MLNVLVLGSASYLCANRTTGNGTTCGREIMTIADLMPDDAADDCASDDTTDVRTTAI